MDLNYWILIPVVLAVILLLAWLVRRNIKDGKKYEKQVIESEQKPDKH